MPAVQVPATTVSRATNRIVAVRRSPGSLLRKWGMGSGQSSSHLRSAASAPVSPLNTPAPRLTPVTESFRQGPGLFVAAAASGDRLPRPPLTTFGVDGNLEKANFGSLSFSGANADKYLRRHGLSADTLKTSAWVEKDSDKVAAAILDWAKDNGASCYTHWFQPMGASGFRHGQAGGLTNTMVEFTSSGQAIWKFSGKDMLNSQTDGSSFPNGGLRATHTAAAFITIDPDSPPFIMGDTVYLPSVVGAYTGVALDEKTPLHRASQALSKQGKRLLGLMGHNTSGLVANIGLEQELFLVNREAYYKRPDLQFAGRTVTGRAPPRGQEMSDHYMAPLSEAQPALMAMTEIQERCFKLGIPLRTRHREVAPNQYEFAPMFGPVHQQIDQNLVVMQIVEETAAKYGLAALLQEKPFQGVNGSGKHNNWSISTLEGAQLLNPVQLLNKTGNKEIFPVVMAALLYAIDSYGDLMRMAISPPGNDFRLGAMEAPPAVISTYLGDDMTSFLNRFVDGATEAYTPREKELAFGVDNIRPISIPAEDRNRTSPFPYGGARFEFRAVGSSQNVSLVNTVLATLTADGFKLIADRVEAGEKPAEVARDLLKKHFRVVFNGNGYDKSWPDKADELGLWQIKSGVEALARFTEPKNMALFERHGVFNAEECAARRVVLLKHYIGTVEVEALTLVDIINLHAIPSAKKAGFPEHVAPLSAAAEKVKHTIHEIAHMDDEFAAAKAARTLRLETMIEVRKLVDALEAIVP